MPPAVIYSNQARTTILIDIPASIEAGQQIPYRIKSTPALVDPYPSTEPKGIKREALLATIPVEERLYHDSLQKDISAGLAEIQDHRHGRSGRSYWCHDRHALLSDRPMRTFSFSLGPLRSASASTDVSLLAPAILSTTEIRTRFPSIDCLCDLTTCNPSRHNMVVLCTADAGEFLIPAGASFILSTVERGLAGFHRDCQTLLPAPNKHFHLVLMDPPWSNRSARRSGAYRTSEDQDIDPFPQAMRIVGECLAPGGLVAIWITNKVSVRKEVLEVAGLLNLHLQEEWVWIKTTTSGAPVTALDGVWRRPYEILLLFREGQMCEAPRRRIIAAVPDLHSRKPCLKALLEEFLPEQYNALELFARSLTAGWWSWGDEVLKFQHESQWCREEARTIDEE